MPATLQPSARSAAGALASGHTPDEDALDEALEETFPASDPIAVTFHTPVHEITMSRHPDSHKSDQTPALKAPREK